MKRTIRPLLFSERVKKTLNGKFIYLFLDYDGTLAPIAHTPAKAVMPENTFNMLRRLSKDPNCKIAIVSGRSLEDISRRVGLEDIVYVGNHGFEIKGAGIEFKVPLSSKHRKTIVAIKSMLEKKLSSISGVLIEDKGFSVSLHYRLADARDFPSIRKGARSVLIPYIDHKDVIVKTGKMVFEIMPPIAWDKGKAVLWLLKKQKSIMGKDKKNSISIYIGDDTTDEDAFRALGNKGITVFVGRPKRTRARFRLRGASEVAVFLRSVLAILAERRP